MPQTQNTADVFPTDQNDESVEIREDSFNIKLSDDDLKTMIDNKIKNANAYWKGEKISERSDVNYKYWKGDQINVSNLRDDEEKGVENVIFRNIETYIPIATSRTPELTVTPAYKNEATRQYSKDIKNTLQTEYEVLQKMKVKVARAIRNHNHNFLGVLKYGYDPDNEEFWTEEVSATNLVINKDGSFVAEYIKDETVEDVIGKFPEKRAEILASFGYPSQLEATRKILDSPMEYLECWTDEYVVWKYRDIILGKGKNPNWDYDGVEMPTGQMEADENGMGKPVMSKVFYNHYKNPKMPYLFLSYWNLGKHIFDETTLIEQAIGSQDWINKRKRQIGANADSMNGHWIASGDAISKEEFMKVEGGIDEKIWLEKGIPADGITKIFGGELPEMHFRDLQDSRQAVDNLMGTHSTSRGEKSGNDTATQDIMQKDQDYGRVDGYVRLAVESLVQEWYEAQYHLYLVYQTEDKSIAIPEEDDFESDNVIFGRERVPLIQKKNGDTIIVPLLLVVKQGTTLPRDDASMYQRAVQFKDILAPIDFFKMVGEPNPKELTKNLLIWQTDPYSMFADDPEIQEMLAKKQQQEQMAMQQQDQRDMQKEQTKQQINADQGDGQPVEEEVQGEDGEVSSQGVGNALNALMQQQGQK